MRVPGRPLTVTTSCALASIFAIAAVAAACGSESGAGAGGSSGGASGSSGFGDLGDGGSSGQGDGGLGGGCARETKAAQKIPVDMMIGLDTSHSMDFEDKWLNVRAALKSFVGNPAYSSLGIGVQFFPLRRQCNVGDYQNVAVGLLLQAQAIAPVSAALDGQSMFGGTPIVPILQGLTKYLAANAKSGRKPVVVLATDGLPDDSCPSAENGQLPNTLENAAAVADAALKGTPPITTFVIGVGGELTALNTIAAAGGTGTATLVDSGGNAQQAFLTALDTIRRQAIPCDYDIPTGTIDPKSTNVTYSSGGSSKALVFVADEAGCSKAPNGEGWYFDNEAAPKKVILCKTLCEVVKKDDLGNVDLVFGCPRNDVK